MSGSCIGWKRLVWLLQREFRSFFSLGVLLFCANLLNSVSLGFAGITLTYTVKAAIPVFTVALCSLRGTNYSSAVYLSLVPTVAGVALASASDSSFHTLGFLAAVGSCASQTLMNVNGKDLRASRSYVSGFECFFLMATAATCLAAPLYVFAPVDQPPVFSRVGNGINRTLLSFAGAREGSYGDAIALNHTTALFDSRDENNCEEAFNRSNKLYEYTSHEVAEELDVEKWQQAMIDVFDKETIVRDLWPLMLVLAAALAYELEYALNFIFVGCVDPVTFAVCDIGRRLSVIITGAILFDKHLTMLNLCGIALALAGVLAYSVFSKHKNGRCPASNISTPRKRD